MSSGRRFESLTDEDLEKLIESKDSNNTKQVGKTSVRLLEEYVSVKGNLGVKTVTEMDTASVQVMTLTLRKFQLLWLLNLLDITGKTYISCLFHYTLISAK
jgi:hypothetical protein